MKNIKALLKDDVSIVNNLIVLKEDSDFENQAQTNEVFSDKWKQVDEKNLMEKGLNFQKEW